MEEQIFLTRPYDVSGEVLHYMVFVYRQSWFLNTMILCLPKFPQRFIYPHVLLCDGRNVTLIDRAL